MYSKKHSAVVSHR